MSHKWKSVAALAMVLALAGAWAEQSFVHTDDGCPVEIHCLACRLALGTAAVATADVAAPTPTLEDLGSVAPAIRHAHADPATERAASRGPPSA
jgi:hypothetical protein